MAERSNAAENRFWLQVMGDKARFILNALHGQMPAEEEQANKFIILFDDLLAQSRQEVDQSALNPKAFNATQDFRRFILQIVREQVSQKNIIEISPSYLNVYVNETELYLDVLSQVSKNSEYKIDALNEILRWSIDGYIGVIYIKEKIGVTFLEYKNKAQVFADSFLVFYMRAYVFNGLRRTGLMDYPSLQVFYKEIANMILKYAEFLVDIITLTEKKQYLGNLSMLDVDNMYRIVCYVMNELSTVIKINPPACDPASPRKE